MCKCVLLNNVRFLDVLFNDYDEFFNKKREGRGAIPQH